MTGHDQPARDEPVERPAAVQRVVAEQSIGRFDCDYIPDELLVKIVQAAATHGRTVRDIADLFSPHQNFFTAGTAASRAAVAGLSPGDGGRSDPAHMSLCGINPRC